MKKEMIGRALKSAGMGVLAGLVISKGADMIANAMVKKMDKKAEDTKNETVEEKIERVEQELKDYKKRTVKRNMSNSLAIFAALEVVVYLLLKEIANVKDACMLNSMMIHDIGYHDGLIDEENVIRLFETIAKHAKSKDIREYALNALNPSEEV